MTQHPGWVLGWEAGMLALLCTILSLCPKQGYYSALTEGICKSAEKRQSDTMQRT